MNTTVTLSSQRYLDRLDHLHPNAFGTADVYRPDHTLYVMDFNYGAGTPVEAKDNLQLEYYALSVTRKTWV